MSSSLVGWNFTLLCLNAVSHSPMERQIGYVYVLNSASLWKKKNLLSCKSYEIFAILLLRQKKSLQKFPLFKF